MQDVQGALESSQSDDWAERVAAGRLLSRHAGDPFVDAALCRLLDDADNTAVPDEVGRALLEKATPAAVRVFARQYRAATNDEAGDCLHYLLLDDEFAWERLTSVFIALTGDSDSLVSEGAAEVLAYRERLRG